MDIPRSDPRDFAATLQKQPFIRVRTWSRKVYYSFDPYTHVSQPSGDKWYKMTLLQRDKGVFVAHVHEDYNPRKIDTSSRLMTPDGSEYRGFHDKRVTVNKLSARTWNKLFDQYVQEAMEVSMSEELRFTPYKMIPSRTARQYAGKWQRRDAVVIERPYTVRYDKPYGKSYWRLEIYGRSVYFVDPVTGLLQGTRAYERVDGEKEILIEESEYAFAPTGDEEKWLDPAVVTKEANTLHRGYVRNSGL